MPPTSIVPTLSLPNYASFSTPVTAFTGSVTYGNVSSGTGSSASGISSILQIGIIAACVIILIKVLE